MEAGHSYSWLRRFAGCQESRFQSVCIVERLRATVTEQAVALHLHQGQSGWD